MLPGSRSLNRPNPVRSTVPGRTSHATAVRGCQIAARRRLEEIAHVGLDQSVERLVDVMREGIERAGRRATAR